MKGLPLLVLGVLLAGCNPYVAAVSLTTQAYGVATDMRSVSTQAADAAIEAQIKTALLTSSVSGTGSISVYCRQGEVVLAGVLPRRSPAGFTGSRPFTRMRSPTRSAISSSRRRSSRPSSRTRG